MKTTYPWYKYFPSDHIADTRLQFISLAACGLYRYLFDLAYVANKSGRLIVNGNALTDADISLRRGVPLGDVQTAYDVLRNAKLIQIKSGVIFIPDLVGMLKKREADAERKRRQRNGKRDADVTDDVTPMSHPMSRGRSHKPYPNTQTSPHREPIIFGVNP